MLGNQIDRESGHPIQGRSGTNTRSQEQEDRWVGPSLQAKLGFGLRLGSEVDDQSGLKLGSGHSPSQRRFSAGLKSQKIRVWGQNVLMVNQSRMVLKHHLVAGGLSLLQN